MKTIKLFTITILLALLCSCSSKPKADDNLAQFSMPYASVPSVSVAATVPSDPPVDLTGDHLDISGMSSTMIFAELTDISMNPDNYDGKTLTMRGQFTSIFIEEENERYYACYVMDDTGCCLQGFEFVADGLTYPDDYPEEGAYFKVTGTITLYEKDGQLYRHLTDATIEIE
ncbi:MAG: hypothetical protein K6F83_03665 [Clostridiales bacterium]|nr:hypothetical protein [Clostridiales bacterium]